MTKDQVFNKKSEIRQLLLQTEKYQNLASQVLLLLNQTDGKTDLIREILFLLKVATGFEAVGIRLKDGDDFPYYETIGFSKSFVKAERYLCSRDGIGDLIRDSVGNPYLECMCGNIICGRTDPSRPFFSEGGSFWTNSTSELLASTSAKDRQVRTRNRCNGEGYESVALIPLRYDKKIIGLLQLNDRRKNLFTENLIQFFEGVGSSIGVALNIKESAAAIARYKKNLETISKALGTYDDEHVDYYHVLHDKRHDSINVVPLEESIVTPDRVTINDNRVKQLTKREQEILRLIVSGLSAKEIADKLGISNFTVKAHRTRIKQKLDIHKSIELVAYALNNKLL